MKTKGKYSFKIYIYDISNIKESLYRLYNNSFDTHKSS